MNVMLHDFNIIAIVYWCGSDKSTHCVSEITIFHTEKVHFAVFIHDEMSESIIFLSHNFCDKILVI